MTQAPDEFAAIEEALDQIMPTVAEIRQSVLDEGGDAELAMAPSLVTFRGGSIFTAAMCPDLEVLAATVAPIASQLGADVLVLVSEIEEQAEAEAQPAADAAGLPAELMGGADTAPVAPAEPRRAVSFSCVDADHNAAFVVWGYTIDGNRVDFQAPEVVPPFDPTYFDRFAAALSDDVPEHANPAAADAQVLMAALARLERAGGNLSVFAPDDATAHAWMDAGLEPELIQLLADPADQD